MNNKPCIKFLKQKNNYNKNLEQKTHPKLFLHLIRNPLAIEVALKFFFQNTKLKVLKSDSLVFSSCSKENLSQRSLMFPWGGFHKIS